MEYTKLTTRRGEAGFADGWDVHPQPQLRRERYAILNGQWEFAHRESPGLPEHFPMEITLPFCPEAALSGIGRHFPEGSHLYYRRSFALSPDWNGGRVLLHIGAADQYAEIYVNQSRIGDHLGGYESFCFDITDALSPGENTLTVHCVDDLRDFSQPYGKQVLPEKRGGMWYTPVSGIWQSVWLEWVPEIYVNHLEIQVSTGAAQLTVSPALSGRVVLESGEEFPLTEGRAHIQPREIHPWSPETPYLYRFTLLAGADRLESYFALRTLEIRTLQGIPRLCLNGRPYFFHGLLDQGYWPDGLFLPAAPEGYDDDILAMKALGFNTLRKHIKVEPEQFYYACDRLGMIVFQDMVNNSDYAYFRDTVLPTVGVQRLPDRRMHREPGHRQAFLRGMEAAVRQLKNHPCICYWTIFNEGWGQFDSDGVYPLLKALDSSRIIDSTSGWFRRSRTDVDSRHIYFTPWSALQPSDKPLVLSEFGGYACSIAGHIFNPEKAYGYRTCTDTEGFQRDLTALYMEKVLPAIDRGLCAAIYTQVSDVEDEINGLLTYDRKVCKADAAAMQAIAAAIREKYARLE